MDYPPPPSDTVTIYLRLPKDRIAALQGLLEGYEGWMSMRTLSPRRGIVELLVSPSFLDRTRDLLETLRDEFGYEEVGPDVLGESDDLNPL